MNYLRKVRFRSINTHLYNLRKICHYCKFDFTTLLWHTYTNRENLQLFLLQMHIAKQIESNPSGRRKLFGKRGTAFVPHVHNKGRQ